MCRYLGILLVSALAAVTGCTQQKEPPAVADSRLKIVATTGPVGDLVRNIVGDRAVVDTMMGPGIDPHLYRASPSDTIKLNEADVVFYSGLHLEGRMGETFERLAKRRPVFAVTQGLLDSGDPRLLTSPDFAGHADPHVWHDVALWRDCAQYVADRMCEADPDNTDSYQQSASGYISELTALDQECRDALQQIPPERRILVTAHDAFAYFSKAYGLETVGLKGVSTEDEVDLQHMSDVVELIVEHKVPCVFVESAVAPQIMQALAEQVKGHQVYVPHDESQQLYADALGKPDSGADTYLGMIRANVKTIVAGLTGKLEEAAKD